jgi:predicted dehydrogenase
MKTRIGIIGAGVIVEDAHLPVLKNLQEAEVSWIADVNSKRAKLLGEMYGVRQIAPSTIESALQDIDVCLIAIPIGARTPYLEACAQAGVAVYVEKPFARTRQEHESYCTSFSDYQIAVGFQRRLYKPLGVMQELIENQYFGQLLRVEFDSGSYNLKSGGAQKYITDPILSGGGLVIDSGIHGLDQILFTTGADDLQLKEIEAVVFNGIDYETSFSTEIIAKESRFTVQCNLTRVRNIAQGFKFHFEAATASFDLSPDASVFVTSVEGKRIEKIKLELSSSNVPRATTINQSFYLFWTLFLQGLSKREANLTSASSSILTTKWIEEIYQNIVHD